MTVSSIRIIFTWTYSPGNIGLALLRNLERLHILAKCLTTIVLARRDVHISSLSEGVRTAWGRTHIDVRGLALSQAISSICIILTWAYRFLSPSLTLLRDLERLNIGIEALSIVILAWCHIDIAALSE